MAELEKKTEEERREYYRKHFYDFGDRLVLKVVGKRSDILRFLKDIHKLYPPNAINVSPIKSDNVNPRQSIFINIFYELMDKEIIRKLEPPEEPPTEEEL